MSEQVSTITDDGKTLYLRVKGPDNIEMKTWSSAPTTNYDAENPGTVMVGFEFDVPPDTFQSFEVILVPKPVAAEADFLGASLSEW